MCYLQKTNFTSKVTHTLKSASLAYSFYKLFAVTASLHQSAEEKTILSSFKYLSYF